jgi:uncharacterized protein (TIGR02117 family)
MRKLLLSIVCSLGLVGCAAPMSQLYPPKNGEVAKSVYVVSHGWHTGLVVKVDDLPEGLLPEKYKFSEAKFLEIGWGDKGFYQAQTITAPLVVQAIFWPSDSVLHVVGFSKPIDEFFAHSEIIRLTVSQEGFLEMLNHIDASFDRRKVQASVDIKSGLYGESYFYPAKGNYHMLKTCNNWTANMLRATGVPITSLYAASASNVITQTYMRGEVIRMFERQPILHKKRRN